MSVPPNGWQTTGNSLSPGLKNRSCFVNIPRNTHLGIPLSDTALRARNIRINSYLGGANQKPVFRFFRQLRHRLLRDNRLGRYLFYALGEILLVVIGILIALQIDNWNEDRKRKQQEIALLGDMKTDLQEISRDLQFGKDMNLSTVTNFRTLLAAIDRDEPWSPKIDSASVFINYFHVPRFRRTTYESLKSQPGILTNERLKRSISDLYDRRFTYLTEDQLKIEWAIYNQQTLLYNGRYLRYRDEDSDTPVAYPVDFEKMKSDTGFINYLSSLVGFRKYGAEVYQGTIEGIDKVIGEIDREIADLEK